MKHDHSAFAPSQAYARPYAAVSREEIDDRVRRFLPLVNRSAWHVFGSGREGLEVEDLVQAGIVALTECAQRHSGPTEDGFAAYAKIRVRGAMLDQIRRTLHDTRTARRKRAIYTQTVDALKVRTGTEPTRAQIADAMHVSDSELLDIEASAVSVSSMNDAYDETNTSFASDDPDPFDMLVAQQDREHLVNAMESLADRQKLVLQLFFVEELNLTEIAAVLEASVPRVHQLRAKALKDLRAAMESEGA